MEVEEHAEEARKAGLDVRMERFEGSPHVAHARTGPERYWGVVQKVWEDATASFAEGLEQEFEVEFGRIHFGVGRTEKPSSPPSPPSCIPCQHQAQEEGANLVYHGKATSEDNICPRTHILASTSYKPHHSNCT